MKYYQLISIFLCFVLLGCQQQKQQKLEPGVSYSLAKERADDISNVEYILEMDVPDSAHIDIEAKSIITFDRKSQKKPLIMDFTGSYESIKSVTANGEKAFFGVESEHLMIPARYISSGKNVLSIEFTMGNGALNRNEDYLYSLFVPDRARTAVPCFDQPDIKARISYSVNMPKAWTAITNGKEDFYEEIDSHRKHVTFTSSQPISTYLWAFAIGDFKKITEQRNGFEVSIYHMEKDLEKIAQNTKAIFDQVFHSIQWLEDYTEVDFPFKKYDLVCIPSFQFGGMEHPGAIYYRSELLFLDENPTQKQVLNRAQLIAHETAHLWFGDLVTMKWFSGVWQKEVFANFIADKIVKEQFPDLNHQLTFLINHFPASFSVDRTIAANPIGQKLTNMNDAGSMYGSIIYHKAPIMMNQLEHLTGKELLRKGLGKYLREYGYGNASWNDLMKILNDLSEYDLELWSNNWVNEAGRPVIHLQYKDDQLKIKQKAEYSDSPKVWAQRVNFKLINDSSSTNYMSELLSATTVVEDVYAQPKYILPTIDEAGYGLFVMDPVSLQYALNNIHIWDEDLVKGTVLIQLYENFLVGSIHPKKYLEMLQRFIIREDNEQLLSLACKQLFHVFWRFTSPQLRDEISIEIEDVLMEKIKSTSSVSIGKMLLMSWSELVSTPQGLQKLEKIVLKKKKVNGISLSERDLRDMAFDMALRHAGYNEQFIVSFAKELNDDEVKNMMMFVSPVFAEDIASREAFFNGLQNIENRKKENWVLTAVYFLHHPYHQEKSLKYLNGALDLTLTLKQTGDIFFPKNWLDMTCLGYGSIEALQIMDYFFKDNPQYPEDLKSKILQSADKVERSRMVKEKYLN
ncbi:hypothetical protein E9993_13130 [Labilibacter sediminis]|nr:hypothetical protein E9993_13130 [Labilibacter sediminis]